MVYRNSNSRGGSSYHNRQPASNGILSSSANNNDMRKQNPNVNNNVLSSHQPNEYISFKTKLGKFDGPTIKVMKVIKYQRGSTDIYNWFMQIQTVISTNEYDDLASIQVLRLYTEDNPHCLFINAAKFSAVISVIKAYFFTRNDFYLYKRQLDELRLRDSPSVFEYLQTLRWIENMANCYVEPSQYLTSREMFEILIKGLPVPIRKIALDSGISNPDKLALRIDSTTRVYKEFEIRPTNIQESSRNKTFQQPFLQNPISHSTNKYCSYHKTTSHSDSECKVQDKQSSDHTSASFKWNTKGITTTLETCSYPSKLTQPSSRDYNGAAQSTTSVLK